MLIFLVSNIHTLALIFPGVFLPPLASRCPYISETHAPTHAPPAPAGDIRRMGERAGNKVLIIQWVALFLPFLLKSSGESGQLRADRWVALVLAFIFDYRSRA